MLTRTKEGPGAVGPAAAAAGDEVAGKRELIQLLVGGGFCELRSLLCASMHTGIACAGCAAIADSTGGDGGHLRHALRRAAARGRCPMVGHGVEAGAAGEQGRVGDPRAGAGQAVVRRPVKRRLTLPLCPACCTHASQNKASTGIRPAPEAPPDFARGAAQGVFSRTRAASDRSTDVTFVRS